ncbi:MAG: carbamoyltransferase family protein [Vicinamibacteria bacterium]
MNVLGINAYHGDVSAVLVREGELAAAVEEERFRRVKHCSGFPAESIRSCLDLGGIDPKNIDHFAVSRDPRAHLWRKALFALGRRPGIDLVRDRLRNRSRISSLAEEIAAALGLPESRVRERLHWVEHHPAHLASAFFVSPFEEAAICAIDGFGDFVSTSTAIGRGSRLEVLDRVFFPHSLGLLYLAITQYLGFPKYGDEFKVMGLAPYGKPDFAPELRKLVRLERSGGFELALSFFRHHSEGVAMTWDDGEPVMGPVFSQELERLLGPARRPDELITERHEAIAASLQLVFEEAAFHVLNGVYERTRSKRLCLAGGCAMNSVANGKIRARTPFERVFIQPAAGDNGTALGAAFYVWNHVLQKPRAFEMKHGFWGPSFEKSETFEGARYFEDFRELADWTAERIAAGKIVGWFQGRMEWGARALGNRSILADPRRSDMREVLNTKIKFREKFRPFAPSILEERLSDYFEGAVPDPFMIQVYPVKADKRAVIPAVTHVDGTGRLQTVSRDANPLYWELIRAFERRTGVPVLLNTSFNENEPIVHRPEEALHCFQRTEMDVLVVGNRALEKTGAEKREAMSAWS